MKDIRLLLNKFRDQKVKLILKGEDLDVVAYGGKLSPEIIDEIRSNKADIISYLKDQEYKQAVFAKPIPKIEIGSDYPLSNSQFRLWLISQSADGSVAYNMPHRVTLEGQYNVAYFQKAVSTVVERHEILRTIFRENDENEVRQAIIPAEHFHFTFAYKDYRGESDPVAAANTYVEQDMKLPFDLSEGPLFRAALLQTEDERYELYFNLHHIISDEWSMEIVSGEVMAYYHALISGSNVEASPLPIQYKDYATWLLKQIEENRYKEYWLGKLSGQITTIDLPSAKSRPIFKTYNGFSIGTHIEAEVISRLRNFTVENGGSLFMGLLSAWNILFYRYTGQKDIIVGSTTAGRDHNDLKGQIGFYINMLALRNEVKSDDSFHTFYEHVKLDTLEAYRNQLYPFDKVVEDLDLHWDNSRSPLFDIIFNYHGNKEGKTSLDAGITVLGASKAKYDLSINLTEVSEGVDLVLNYNKDVYDQQTMESMIGHFRILLNDILNNTTAPVKSLKIINQVERVKLTRQFNSSRQSFESGNIVDMFHSQTKANPDKVAVRFGNSTISYIKLDEATNRVANYLIKNNIQKDDLVPICIERSVEMVIGILGVLKAGAAYVPIDPSFPDQRITHMLKDTHAGLVISSKASKQSLGQTGLPVVSLDEDTDLINSESDNPGLNIAGSDLAYIVYTSGSTGLPKGVMVEHHAIYNHIVHHRKEFDISKDENLLLFSNFIFDASVEQMFLSLTSGCTLEVASVEDIQDIERFTGLLREREISHLHATPSFLANVPLMDYPGLKRVRVGGERCPLELATAWGAKYTFINKYGPTETTVAPLGHHYNQSTDYTSSLPIGKPISNTTAYILDEDLNLMPVLATGELCISGSSLARGYLNNPLLTSEKFVRNPFEEGSKLYKTGDLARWLPDGNIEFVGRKDDQLKVGGYRIEPGEVEAALEKIEGLSQAVVTAVGAEGMSLQLAAYIVCKNGEIEHDEVRRQLESALPHYMVPKVYITLKAMPITKTGKVNRKALPVPEFLSNQHYIAPSTKIEVQLVNIWQRVFNLEKIGVNDSFFDLGGNSLVGIKLVSEYNKEFSKSITIRDLYRNPVLSSHIALLGNSVSTRYSEILPIESAADYQLSNSQLRLFLISRENERSIAYNIPHSFPLEGEYDIDTLKRAVHSVVDRHEILRTVFKENETGEVRQVVRSTGELGLEIPFHDFTGKENAEEAAAEYIASDSLQPFDLSNGPVFRTALLKVAEKKHIFYVNLHHIISDEWSTEVMSRELMAYYQAYRTEETPDLAPLKIQFKDFAAWQLKELEGETYAKHREYWMNKLEGDIPLLELPSAKVRPPVQTFNGHRTGTMLDADTTKKLRKFANETGGSIFMGCAAAWQALMYRYTSEKDIITGTIVSGRNHSDLKDQIGFYVNIAVLRSQVNPEDKFSTFYKQVRDDAFDAYEHQMYPFDRLINDLDIRIDVSRNPLVDIVLSHHAVPQLDPSFKEEVLVDLGGGVTKFDIELHILESGNNIGIVANYNTDIYEKKVIDRLLLHYKAIIANLIKNPQEKISRLDFLPEQEKHKILYEFNQTTTDYPSGKSLVELFTEQVDSTPDAIAVEFKEIVLSYKELDVQSNRLANYLLTHFEVSQNDLIGIKLGRNQHVIISMLAILKMGAAYVPIDPDYPSQRIAYIENNSGCLFTINEDLITIFQGDTDYNDQAPEINTTARDLSYVMYTSGSTGEPKGVMIEGKSITRLVKDTNYYNFTPSDVILSTGALSFDATTFEYWGPLLNGAKLVICSKSDLLDSRSFKEAIISHGVNVLWLTSGWLNHLVNGQIDLFEPLSTLVAGGDKLSPFHIEKLRKQYPGLTIINGYGPTENTTFSLTHDIQQVDGDLPIGAPVSNSTAYILNDEMLIQPIGITGEIYLGGDGLARGYLKEPALTEEKFISHPYKPGEKLYKTGDLGRWRAEGIVDFMGRIDNQFKIRGFRIELGEIENALMTYSTVSQAVVTVGQHESGPVLVAYIVPQNDFDKQELRNNLSNVLPDYMLPTYFVEVDAMPLNPNGKVEKKALPEYGMEDMVQRNYLAPVTDTEKRMATIWEEVLDLDKVGITDNFFEIGGDSLKLMNIVWQIEDKYNIQVPVKDFYAMPTIKELAKVIDLASAPAVERKNSITI
ncbi:amino acid adenylation domain-containing protein [Roseivirga sp. BDSF3-8]|uniref:amino acid adenylation domain-containing protein n=1 Tax=Roseivirga sp. BDSF3-8 TaxID=3241598 RepID=UPI003531CE0C